MFDDIKLLVESFDWLIVLFGGAGLLIASVVVMSALGYLGAFLSNVAYRSVGKVKKQVYYTLSWISFLAPVAVVAYILLIPSRYAHGTITANELFIALFYAIPCFILSLCSCVASIESTDLYKQREAMKQAEVDKEKSEQEAQRQQDRAEKQAEEEAKRQQEEAKRQKEQAEKQAEKQAMADLIAESIIKKMKADEVATITLTKESLTESTTEYPLS